VFPGGQQAQPLPAQAPVQVETPQTPPPAPKELTPQEKMESIIPALIQFAEQKSDPGEVHDFYQQLITEEEYEDAMNKLPIDEKAIIKDVLNQIKVDNRINRNSKRIEDAFKKDKYESTKIKACLVCIGTIAYIGTALIMR
jgi:hypothetical protein